jgi:anti-sigma regulatory factor (Ser/Thr protein kinase)
MAERSHTGHPDRLHPGRRVAISLGNALVFSVAGGPQASAAAREEIRQRLGPKLDPDVVELAQLLLSELVSNCVLHGVAGGPDAWVDIAASIHPHSLWVEVSDGGPSFHHRPRRPSPQAESGRGLYLVQELSSRWGISEDGPASVWFELPRAAE